MTNTNTFLTKSDVRLPTGEDGYHAPDLPKVGDYYLQTVTAEHPGVRFTALWHDDFDGIAHFWPESRSLEFLEGFLEGKALGEGNGYADGHRAGVEFIRNGLHALLGTASASALNQFIAEVRRDMDDGR